MEDVVVLLFVWHLNENLHLYTYTLYFYFSVSSICFHLLVLCSCFHLQLYSLLTIEKVTLQMDMSSCLVGSFRRNNLKNNTLSWSHHFGALQMWKFLGLGLISFTQYLDFYIVQENYPHMNIKCYLVIAIEMFISAKFIPM